MSGTEQRAGSTWGEAPSGNKSEAEAEEVEPSTRDEPFSASSRPFSNSRLVRRLGPVDAIHSQSPTGTATDLRQLQAESANCRSIPAAAKQLAPKES